jgi:hypothetical protein
LYVGVIKKKPVDVMIQINKLIGVRSRVEELKRASLRSAEAVGAMGSIL